MAATLVTLVFVNSFMKNSHSFLTPKSPASIHFFIILFLQLTLQFAGLSVTEGPGVGHTQQPALSHPPHFPVTTNLRYGCSLTRHNKSKVWFVTLPDTTYKVGMVCSLIKY